MPVDGITAPPPGKIGSQYAAAGNTAAKAPATGALAPKPLVGQQSNFFDPEVDCSEVDLSGWSMPGHVVDVKGADWEYEWTVQKGTGTGGATTVAKGEKIAEGIEITLEANDRATFAALNDIRDKVKPQTKGGKPPTFRIKNPIVNWNGVDRVSIKKITQPEVTKGLSWKVTLTFIQYKPSVVAKTGPAEPAKPGDAPTPKDSADKAIVELQKQMSKL